MSKFTVRSIPAAAALTLLAAFASPGVYAQGVGVGVGAGVGVNAGTGARTTGAAANTGAGLYGSFAPFGLSGGFYYGRVAVKF